MENWKSIPGFPSYEASDLGRIRRARRGTGRSPVGMIVQAKPKTKGYFYVRLIGGGKPFWPRLQGIIALTFHGPRPEGHEVSHINGDLTDNSAANLAYETKSANNQRKHAHGTMPMGDHHHMRRTAQLEARP